MIRVFYLALQRRKNTSMRFSICATSFYLFFGCNNEGFLLSSLSCKSPRQVNSIHLPEWVLSIIMKASVSSTKTPSVNGHADFVLLASQLALRSKSASTRQQCTSLVAYSGGTAIRRSPSN